MTKKISPKLLRKINPSLDDDCSNLLSGVNYCVLPMKDWNAAQSSKFSLV